MRLIGVKEGQHEARDDESERERNRLRRPGAMRAMNHAPAIRPRLAVLLIALAMAACDRPVASAPPADYTAFEGRWAGTIGDEDWEIAVSVGYGRGLVRVQTPRGMAWQALPDIPLGEGQVVIASRFGGTITMGRDGGDSLAVRANFDAGHGEGAFQRWGGTQFVRFDLPFAAANALTTAALDASAGGIRFRRMAPGTDRADACSGSGDDSLFIDLFDPLEPVFVRAPAGPTGNSVDSQHAFRVVAARRDGADGPIILGLESVEPRSGVQTEVTIAGAGSEAITLLPSGAVYADCGGPAIAD
jgi:hypothetical protein